MSRTFIQSVVSIACELLIIKDPYQEPYHAPVITHESVDDNGYPVIHVKADNYIDVCDITKGTTHPGDVYRSAVHTGYKTWEIRVEPFGTEGL